MPYIVLADTPRVIRLGQGRYGTFRWMVGERLMRL